MSEYEEESFKQFGPYELTREFELIGWRPSGAAVIPTPVGVRTQILNFIFGDMAGQAPGGERWRFFSFGDLVGTFDKPEVISAELWNDIKEVIYSSNGAVDIHECLEELKSREPLVTWEGVELNTVTIGVDLAVDVEQVVHDTRDDMIEHFMTTLVQRIDAQAAEALVPIERTPIPIETNNERPTTESIIAAVRDFRARYPPDENLALLVSRMPLMASAPEAIVQDLRIGDIPVIVNNNVPDGVAYMISGTGLSNAVRIQIGEENENQETRNDEAENSSEDELPDHLRTTLA